MSNIAGVYIRMEEYVSLKTVDRTKRLADSLNLSEPTLNHFELLMILF